MAATLLMEMAAEETISKAVEAVAKAVVATVVVVTVVEQD